MWILRALSMLSPILVMFSVMIGGLAAALASGVTSNTTVQVLAGVVGLVLGYVFISFTADARSSIPRRRRY